MTKLSRRSEERLFAQLRSLRLDDGRDPFDLYREGSASKGWLIGRIVDCVLSDGRTGSHAALGELEP